MGELINLDEHRPEAEVIVFSMTLSTDGKIATVLNAPELETMEQINWAISMASVGLAELTDLKRQFMRDEPWDDEAE